MRKGAIFTIEACYALIAVFVALVALLGFIKSIEQPSYDLVLSLKVAHDMGEENVSTTPQGYAFGKGNCPKSLSTMPYYDYGGTYPENEKGVCME